MSAQCPQESQVEEAQQTTDESATVPELEEVLNRSKEEIQMSVSEMEDAIRPEESIIRKIQRYFWGSSESPQCVDIQSMVGFATLDVEKADYDICLLLFRDRRRQRAQEAKMKRWWI